MIKTGKVDETLKLITNFKKRKRLILGMLEANKLRKHKFIHSFVTKIYITNAPSSILIRSAPD